MSREQLVGAYLGGRVSRRVFVRGLVALGVSAGAALAYADALSAQTPPAAGPSADIYPDDTTTTSTTLASTTTAAAGSDVGASNAEQGSSGSAATPRFTG